MKFSYYTWNVTNKWNERNCVCAWAGVKRIVKKFKIPINKWYIFIVSTCVQDLPSIKGWECVHLLRYEEIFHPHIMYLLSEFSRVSLFSHIYHNVIIWLHTPSATVTLLTYIVFERNVRSSAINIQLDLGPRQFLYQLILIIRSLHYSLEIKHTWHCA